jgi:hypothetical protein
VENKNNDDKELLAFLTAGRTSLISLLGVDYDKKPVNSLIEEGVKKAEWVINQLQPFAHGDTFPEFYNPRAVHALFAKAFLLVSPYYEIFIKIVRVQTIKSTEKLGFTDRREFVVWMLENFKMYEYMAQFSSGTVHYYGEMNQAFKDEHITDGGTDLVGDHLVLVVDINNPVEHILAEIKALIGEAQEKIKDVFKEMLEEAGCEAYDLRMVGLPVAFGEPLIDSELKTTRSPKTFLPQWFEAFRVRLLKKSGAKEPEIIREIYGESQDDGGYEGRKTLIYSRARLAERLAVAAFQRRPLTWVHRKGP